MKPIIVLNRETLEAKGFDDPKLAAIFMWGKDSREYLFIIHGQWIRTFIKAGSIEILQQRLERCIVPLST